ncbi:hypothetical protein [Acinetobacter terrestris]|uniref:Phage protein n=1 Tax=Acinetobacter terrestris TaxID=2529843 RepID=A0AAW6UV38_9GAMM|nr:hypothetical protein [Acinetobacter terrestris]MDK1683510.1 hypothetical protein [Acinetobacter terrestris]
MDIQKSIDRLDVEIEELKTKIDEEHMLCQDITDLEELIDKAIMFGDLCAKRDAKAQAVPEGFVLVKKRNLIGNPNVDFLQAPRWAKYWLMDGHSKKYWWSSVRPKKDMDLLCYVWGGQHFVGEAPSFGFAGPWNESLTSKKAMIEAQEQKG